MKKSVFFLIILFSLFKAFSQVDKMKNQADLNKNNSEKLGGGDSPCMEGCSEGCFSGIADPCLGAITAACFDFALSGLIQLNNSYIEKKSDIPVVTSFDFIPTAAYNPPNTMLILPRIRGNWGLFSTDARFTSLIEINSQGSDYWNTFDWQILQINALISKSVVVRIGSGFMFENYSKTFFNEHTMGVDIFMDDYKYRIDNEFRFSQDYYTGNIPRMEGNTRFNYALLQTDHIDGYISTGVMYQNYYLDVPVWSLCGGLAFNFH